MKKLEEIKQQGNVYIFEERFDGIYGKCFDSIDHKWFSFVFSWGMGWEHLSVSTPNKTPTWDQMCRMKDLFFEEEETCIQYHPKKSEYVNNHPHCLHIWKPIGIDLLTPPSILIGIKELGELS